MSRATSFNKFNVSAFFNNLINCLSRSHFTPDRIYNLDETGNSTVHVPPKIIATKGTKQVGCMTSGERGLNVTMICAINAAGNHIPPLIIFPRKKCTEPMLLQIPPGSIGGVQIHLDGLMIYYLYNTCNILLTTQSHLLKTKSY